MSNNVQIQNNESSKYTQLIFKINRLTDGGRNLFAIHENTELSQIEKHLMITIAAYMDFSTLKTACSYCDAKTSISITRLLKLLSMKDKSTIIKYADGLCDKGYLKKLQTFSEDSKSYATNAYMITDKIFIEYAKVIGLDLDLLMTNSSHIDSNNSKKDGNNDDTSSNGSRCHRLGVVGDADNYIPNTFLDENNTKVLFSSAGTESPAKNRSKRFHPKDSARRLFRETYRRVRQPNEPATKWIPFTTNEMLDTVFDRLWLKFPKEAFISLHTEFSERSRLGALDWNPNTPERDLLWICEHMSIKPNNQ